MNATDQHDIMTVLNNYANYVSEYADVVFCALFGSQNYSMATERSDIDAYCIIMPPARTLICEEPLPIPRTIETSTGSIKVKTLPDMLKMYRNAAYNMCETLVTPYVIVPERYLPVYIKLTADVDAIVNADIKHQLHSTHGMTMREIAYIKKHGFDDPSSQKALARIMFCDAFTKKRLDGCDFRRALDARTEIAYPLMMALKRGEGLAYLDDTEKGRERDLTAIEVKEAERWERIKTTDIPTSFDAFNDIVIDAGLTAFETYMKDIRCRAWLTHR